MEEKCRGIKFYTDMVPRLLIWSVLMTMNPPLLGKITGSESYIENTQEN